MNEPTFAGVPQGFAIVVLSVVGFAATFFFYLDGENFHLFPTIAILGYLGVLFGVAIDQKNAPENLEGRGLGFWLLLTGLLPAIGTGVYVGKRFRQLYVE